MFKPFLWCVCFVLQIIDLSISIAQTEIISHLFLHIHPGSIHALMGPNGSGKSSLALALMGHPLYSITTGSVSLDGITLNDLSPDKRAQLGLFLAFQYPLAIPGVTVGAFLREACKAMGFLHESLDAFKKRLDSALAILSLDSSFIDRSLHDGFSGGERKKMEILQLLLLKPKFAILDEIDSGLDIDALKIVARGILYARQQNPALALLIITHYQRILEHIVPDCVHIMQPGLKGAIAQSGDKNLVCVLEQKGYDGLHL